MLLNILVDGDPVLRQVSKPVSQVDAALKKLSQNMVETMYAANGVGLAAPQIGQNIRMVVTDWTSERNLPIVWVNPEITPLSKEMKCGVEGCLSVPDYQGQVNRYQSIRVKALNLNGDPIEIELEDFPAVVLQHEVDHLDGILYTDKVIEKTFEKIDIDRLKREGHAV